MNKKIKVIRVTSDNVENRLMYPEAYDALTLSMSTGDWHTHKHSVEYIDFETKIEPIYAFDTDLNEFYTV